jgi:hypothetical protein
LPAVPGKNIAEIRWRGRLGLKRNSFLQHVFGWSDSPRHRSHIHRKGSRSTHLDGTSMVSSSDERSMNAIILTI